MKLRSGSFGQFWGCTGFPKCRKTVKFSAGSAAPVASDGTPATDLEPVESVAAPVELPRPSYSAAREAFDALTARLDANQSKIFNFDPATGNLRVVAAAGSGKTTTTVAFLAGLVWNSHRNATQIVATTFTSKAGKELATRLAAVLPPGALDMMRVGTFHGLALRALRGNGAWDMGHCLDIGRRARGIPSSAKLWSSVLSYAGVEGVPGTGVEGLGLEEPEIKTYQLAIDVLRSHGLVGGALDAAVAEVEQDHGIPYLSRAWGMVQDAKRALGAWDFADALQAYHDVLVNAQPTPGLVVVVDEAQDNSELQINIARLLARAGTLILVGDVRQSIYSWRGAFPKLFLTADKAIGASTLELDTNYRSAKAIVDLGNAVAEGKEWSLGADASAARADAGTVSVKGYEDPSVEGREVAASIRAATHDGASLDSFAILCRTNAMSGAFEAALVGAGIPCVVVGGQPFFKRYEVQNALAYISLSVNDDMDAFARIVNKPRRYLGAKFVEAVRAAPGANLLAKINTATERLNSRQRDAARDLYRFLTELRAAEWPAGVSMIVKLLAPVEADDAGEADADRSGIVAAVASLAKDFFTAQAFLDFAGRCAGEVVEAKSVDGGFELPAGRVTISTIHKAKGLEWSTVFVSCSAGNFPHARATGDRFEEEERLFYVAATRAKDVLALTYSEVDLRDNDAGPSVFLDYVPGFNPEDDGGGEPLPDVEPAADEAGKLAASQVRAELDAFPTVPAVEIAAPVQPQAVVEAPAPVDETAKQDVGALFGAEAFGRAILHAEQATAAEPAASAGEGGRFVQPTLAQFEALLAPLGFVGAGREVEASMHQRVLEFTLDAGEHGVKHLRVYTSIELGGSDARDVGEDSIKVAAVYEGNDGTTKALHKKLPYACRTRGWRVTLLSRIAELAPTFMRQCPRCGASLQERTVMSAGRKFFGCVRYPTCHGSMNVEGA